MIWDNLKHFKRTEAWGNPDKMDPNFLILLDYFREVVGVPFIITSGWASSGHAENSFHYKGRAVDGRFVDKEGKALSLSDQFVLAMRSPFTGIGIYTWSARGTFLHFDNRSVLGERKIWTCEEKGRYANLNGDFLLRHFHA